MVDEAVRRFGALARQPGLFLSSEDGALQAERMLCSCLNVARAGARLSFSRAYHPSVFELLRLLEPVMHIPFAKSPQNRQAADDCVDAIMHIALMPLEWRQCAVYARLFVPPPTPGPRAPAPPPSRQQHRTSLNNSSAAAPSYDDDGDDELFLAVDLEALAAQRGFAPAPMSDASIPSAPTLHITPTDASAWVKQFNKLLPCIDQVMSLAHGYLLSRQANRQREVLQSCIKLIGNALPILVHAKRRTWQWFWMEYSPIDQPLFPIPVLCHMLHHSMSEHFGRVLGEVRLAARSPSSPTRHAKPSLGA